MRAFKVVFGVLILVLFGTIQANGIDQSLCDSGAKVELYPNGSLKRCVLKDVFRSREVDCKGQSPISFYDNGQIKSCALAERAMIGGQKCKQFGTISFYRDGKFQSCIKED